MLLLLVAAALTTTFAAQRCALLAAASAAVVVVVLGVLGVPVVQANEPDFTEQRGHLRLGSGRVSPGLLIPEPDSWDARGLGVGGRQATAQWGAARATLGAGGRGAAERAAPALAGRRVAAVI